MYNTFNEPKIESLKSIFPYDILQPSYSIPKRIYGLFWIIVSAVCSGLGNSLEPVTILSFLSIFLLIIGIEGFELVLWYEILFMIIFITITQSIGFCIGFSTIFGYPHSTPGTIFTTFAVGILYWLFITVFALIPQYFFRRRFHKNSFTFLIYPICETAISIVVLGNVASTFPSIGNSVLDFAPLAQVATLVGLAGVEFYIVLAGTFAAYYSIGYITTNLKSFSYFLYFTLLLFTITGFIIQGDSWYQKNVSSQVVPLWKASCVFGQNEKYGTDSYELVWQNTQDRINEGNNFILWAEETVEIHTDEEEDDLISRGINMTLQSNGVSYLGIAYYKHKHNAKMATNQFVLITPEGNVAWNYKKAHPVPGVESDVKAGPLKVPTYDSKYGKLGGSICFDLDFPSTIRQAGEKKVDIFLQPSWTWNAISTRHFIGDSVRSIENGFTLIRCSSDGESGVVNPRGIIKTRMFTGHDPKTVVTFNVPKEKRIQTMYTTFGFVFEWILLCLLIIILILIIVPLSWLPKSIEAELLDNGLH